MEVVPRADGDVIPQVVAGTCMEYVPLVLVVPLALAQSEYQPSPLDAGVSGVCPCWTYDLCGWKGHVLTVSVVIQLRNATLPTCQPLVVVMGLPAMHVAAANVLRLLVVQPGFFGPQIQP